MCKCLCVFVCMKYMLATQKHELLTLKTKFTQSCHEITFSSRLHTYISKLNACFEGALQTYQVTCTKKLPLSAQSQVTIYFP